MLNLFSSLTSTNYNLQGIKNLKVYYDTLLVNLRANVTTNYEFVLLEKLAFDYADNVILGSDKSFIINFGDVGYVEPYKTNGNCYIDSILLEKSKNLLICGLTALSSNVSQTINGQVHTGHSYVPVVYLYNINDHSLLKIYPKLEADIQEWNAFVIGDIESTQLPIASFNGDNSNLNILFNTTRTVAGSAINCLADLNFTYNGELELNGVQLLTSAIVSGGNYSSLAFVKTAPVEDGKLIFSYTENDTVVPFKLKNL